MDFFSVFCFIACATLLMIWVTGKRTREGFVIIVYAWLLIVLAARSDRQPVTELRIFLFGLAGLGLAYIVYSLYKARRTAQRKRVHVYVPIDKRGRSTSSTRRERVQ